MKEYHPILWKTFCKDLKNRKSFIKGAGRCVSKTLPSDAVAVIFQCAFVATFCQRCRASVLHQQDFCCRRKISMKHWKRVCGKSDHRTLLYIRYASGGAAIMLLAAASGQGCSFSLLYVAETCPGCIFFVCSVCCMLQKPAREKFFFPQPALFPSQTRTCQCVSKSSCSACFITSGNLFNSSLQSQQKLWRKRGKVKLWKLLVNLSAFSASKSTVEKEYVVYCDEVFTLLCCCSRHAQPCQTLVDEQLLVPPHTTYILQDHRVDENYNLWSLHHWRMSTNPCATSSSAKLNFM